VHESDDEDSQIVIINTCGFIDNAKQESIGYNPSVCKSKEEGKI